MFRGDGNSVAVGPTRRGASRAGLWRTVRRSLACRRRGLPALLLICTLLPSPPTEGKSANAYESANCGASFLSLCPDQGTSAASASGAVAGALGTGASMKTYVAIALRALVLMCVNGLRLAVMRTSMGAYEWLHAGAGSTAFRWLILATMLVSFAFVVPGVQARRCERSPHSCGGSTTPCRPVDQLKP